MDCTGVFGFDGVVDVVGVFDLGVVGAGAFTAGGAALSLAGDNDTTVSASRGDDRKNVGTRNAKPTPSRISVVVQSKLPDAALRIVKPVDTCK